MIIEKIEIKNFKSHLNSEIQFNPGITLIIGENGAGKSTILEAISFALYKQHSSSKLSDLIRTNNNNQVYNTMEVSLIFISNGNHYKIIRTRDKSKSASTLYSVYLNEDNTYKIKDILCEGDKNVNKEIERILQSLSKLFYPYAEEIKNDIEYIANLDFIFAKAKYSRFLNGITPLINDKKEINLINAKHPLLDQKIAVPISLELGKTFNTLVITGPNTGGKTVSLKTIGLLTAMACSGLNIPAEEKTSLYVFDKIFADIGDDQSISDSLSTFSSHMKNIVDIVNNSTENSLILVDELGSGTDPIEGASLAISILDHFKNNNSLTVATTHYQELKKYALVTNGFENASVEFDIETLSPTYHLLIGVPGKSNAFEISKKLGLSENIINNAKSGLSKKDVDFEELLKNIYDNKSKIENEKIKITEELEKVSALRKSLERDNSNLIEQEKEIINNAKIKARNILLDAKEKASSIISEMQNSSNSSELNNLRNKLNANIKNISLIASNQDLNNNNNTNNANSNSNSSKNSLDIKEIKPNTKVFITTFGQEGIVLTNVSKSNEVQVQIGIMKTNVNIKYLEKSRNTLNKQSTNKKTGSTASYNTVAKSKTVKSELNVIGLNVDEAIFVVDKFLDDSYLAKLETVRIVHGKGTGKLREGIHKYLKTHPHVKSFRIGTYGEGEMGVTVVTLK